MKKIKLLQRHNDDCTIETPANTVHSRQKKVIRKASDIETTLIAIVCMSSNNHTDWHVKVILMKKGLKT